MLTFVNYKGQPLPPPASNVPRTVTRRDGPDQFHKGWRVVGIPPGAVEAAETEHNRLQARMQDWTKRKPFDRGNWIANAKKKPIRAKPYEIKESAEVCADLATRSGWLSVELVEIKKVKP